MFMFFQERVMLKVCFTRLIHTRNMSVFIQCLNPLTGIINWEEKDENYDYHQEVARSAFADMLHDHERVNILYYVVSK